MQKQDQTAHERLKKALEDFKNQFNVTLESTGYEIPKDRNDGIREEEYWVNGILKSEVEGIDFKIGGWFSIDTRDNEDTIYCNLAVFMNGENMEKNKNLQSFYNKEKQEWAELTYEAF